MKNLKRALRRHQKDVKFKARLKKHARGYTYIITKDRTKIYNPTWVDVRDYMEWSNVLKTMSTTCSCHMCACDKYNRREQKKIDGQDLRMGLEEW